jgi:bifunctional UDP-N-acetylglucosamine pyrophosphorylase / glucosamine-1-phosphate N-acetyltransferase
MGSACAPRLPKVLHPLAGRPLLAHVLDAAQPSGRSGSAWSTATAASGPTALGGADCAWVEQAERLGTGHALMQAMPLLDRTWTGSWSSTGTCP